MVTPANEHAALAAINLAIDSLPESEQDAIRAGVELAMACPRAVVEVLAVLQHGGAKRGVGMGRDGQDAWAHFEKMRGHANAAHDPYEADRDSGLLTVGLVAGRAMLAIEAAEDGR